MTEIDFTVMGAVIGITSAITTAATYVIVNREIGAMKKEICGQIGRLHERVNNVAIRLGIVENEQH